MANVHPWFGDVNIDDAATWTWQFFQTNDVSISYEVDNKPQMYIAETGWPTVRVCALTVMPFFRLRTIENHRPNELNTCPEIIQHQHRNQQMERLHELVHGQRAMSPDTAIRCARQFGIDAGFWLAQQAAWDSFHAWKRLSSASAPSASPR